MNITDVFKQVSS